MVLNVTNQCNLSCTYCYEYGEDKIVDTENGSKPKFMSEETARAERRVHAQGVGRQQGRAPHVLRRRNAAELSRCCRRRSPTRGSAAPRLGKQVDFSLTTNATLLKPEIIEFLAENQVGVTISIDGPREVQDKFRVFHNGAGSYDVVAPKIKELLQAAPQPADRRARDADLRPDGHQADLPPPHRGDRVLGGRLRAGDHVADRGHAISERRLRRDARAVPRSRRTSSSRPSVQNRHHGFSNVKETLEELHKGVSKAFPCGAGLGLLGVATDGDVALCHRFAGSDAHKLGTVRRRHRPSARSTAFLGKHHIDNKTDCSTLLGAAAVLGRLLSRGAHALRRDDAGRTCTTASGSAAGPTSACRFTASSPSAIRRSSRSSTEPAKPARRSSSVMKHLKAVNRKAARDRGAPPRPATSSRCSATGAAAAAALSARLLAGVLAGLGSGSRPAAPPDCASRSSAICSTATSAATGRRRCPTSSITRPTGPASAPRPRRTGARSISSSRNAGAGCTHGAACSQLARPRRSLLVVVGCAVVAACTQRDKPASRAGNGTLIIGAYPKQFWIIDEATEKIVGTIPFKSGIPRRTTLSRDRKRFYTVEAAMEKVEIIDIAARKTIDTFTLSEGNKKVRITQRSSPIRCTGS